MKDNSKHLAMSFLFLYQQGLDDNKSQGELHALASCMARVFDKVAEQATQELELLKTDVLVDDGWEEPTRPFARSEIDVLLSIVR